VQTDQPTLLLPKEQQCVFGMLCLVMTACCKSFSWTSSHSVDMHIQYAQTVARLFSHAVSATEYL